MPNKIYVSNRLIKLINAAADVAGSDTKLSVLIQEGRGRMTSWRSGARACPIEAQILMAKIAGLSISDVMREAVFERNLETKRGVKLREIFEGLKE